MRQRALLAGVTLLVAGSIGFVSASRVRDQLAALAACEAAGRGEWQTVLDATDGLVGGDETGRAAAECRCTALLATGRSDACAALLERVLADPGAEDWAPRPELAVHLIQTWRDAGRTDDAAAFARRAGSVHPENPDLFYLELVTRSSVEDEGAVLRELETRVPASGAAAARMRVSLANRQLLRGDARAALAVLGEAPPPEAGAALGRWFETRGRAFAMADDLAGVQRSYDAWRSAGGNPAELFARYALTLSLTGLADPDREVLPMLSQALEASEGVGDGALREALAIRLLLTLVAAGRQDEAIARYDGLRDSLALEGLSREELLRSAQLAAAPGSVRQGELVFRIPGAARGDALWLSPDADAPADAAYERIPVSTSGEVRASRTLAPHPARWVYRDGAGGVRASGAVTPAPGRALETDVTLGSADATRPVRLWRDAGDGRRRVLVLLPDCLDWRITSYLRARGELPVLDALLRDGHRAVLESDPPLTAAAMEALVWPGRRSGASFVGLVHQVGVELAGLSSIGDNPFAALSWLLPEEQDLFARVGREDRVAANLLFAHGGIRAGRHGEVTGPNGERRRVEMGRSARDLTGAERERWPELAGLPERDAIHVRTIAAELDAFEELAADRGLDLVMLRVEPLDILTHAHFAESVRDGQDDGGGLLFSVYRYLDARLAAAHNLLDADDVLVVMSDHGIRTAMEHSRDAIFVASGGGVPSGRAPGRPDLRGVPRALAALLGVATEWADTGVAPFATPLAVAPLAAAESDAKPSEAAPPAAPAP